MTATIPGLPLAPLRAPCDECDGLAEFVEGSMKDGCSCGIEPPGTHLVRRCPAGHDNETHLMVEAAFLGNRPLGEGASLESRGEEEDLSLNMPIPADVLEQVRQKAKTLGVTPERLVSDLVSKKLIVESKPEPDVYEKYGIPDDIRRVFEERGTSEAEIEEIVGASGKLHEPLFGKSMPVEEAQKFLGKRAPAESLLVEPAFRRMQKSLLGSLEAEGTDLGSLDSVKSSETMKTAVKGFRLIYEAEDDVQVLSSVRLLADGEREFRLSPAIAESLLMTDVKGIDASDLKLPYRSFLVRLPPLIPAKRRDGWMGYTTSVMVTEWRVSDGYWNNLDAGLGQGEERRALMFQAMCGFSPQSKVFSDATSGSWMCLLRGDLDVVPNSKAMNEANEDPGPANAHPLRLITRLVINTILYVSLPGSDVVLEGQESLNRLREQARKHPRGSYKKERAQAALREVEGKPQIRKVGWSIKVPSYVREAALHEHSAKGRAFTASWLVRGHWRKQAVGVGRLQHKLIHIKPHYCRKDLGARLAPSPYVVK